MGWAMTLALAGCTVDDAPADPGEAGGTSEGTDPESSGEETDPDPPECSDDADCSGECGWCDEGVCQEDAGCCGAVGEGPGFWHCSPPPECAGNDECPAGQICQPVGCVPDPEAGLGQPPLCDDDFTLAVEQFPLDVRLTQIAVHEGREGSLVAIDDQMQIHRIDLLSSEATALDLLPGGTVHELRSAGPLAAVAIVDWSAQEGEPFHQLVSLRGPELDEVEPGPFHPGIASDAAWLPEPAVAVVAAEGKLARWSLASGPELQEPLSVDTYAQRIVPVRVAEAGAQLLGVSQPEGVVGLFDAQTGEPAGPSTTLLGSPLALAAIADASDGDGQHLVAVFPAGEELLPAGEPMAALQVMRDLEAGGADMPFGAPGIPRALAVAELDGDGIDEVVVAMDDGRVDIYRMHETDVLCRSFLPLGEIEDLTVGDVDGDGAADIIVADSSPGLTVLHGAGNP